MFILLVIAKASEQPNSSEGSKLITCDLFIQQGKQKVKMNPRCVITLVTLKEMFTLLQKGIFHTSFHKNFETHRNSHAYFMNIHTSSKIANVHGKEISIQNI